MKLPSLEPESSASANSATSADFVSRLISLPATFIIISNPSPIVNIYFEIIFKKFKKIFSYHAEQQNSPFSYSQRPAQSIIIVHHGLLFTIHNAADISKIKNRSAQEEECADRYLFLVIKKYF